MSQASLREHLKNCTCCKKCELVDDGIFCPSCGRLALKLPHDIVNLLRCEEVWAEKWDSLHSLLSDALLNKGTAELLQISECTVRKDL
jgi:hypothetical protein